MIKDSDKKLFEIVLVWKLDRFARNRYDSARYVSYTHLDVYKRQVKAHIENVKSIVEQYKDIVRCV